MNENEDELISALLDGELESAAQDRLVNGMVASDGTSMHRLGRYRLIGDVMRGESAVATTGLAERVHRALAEEPTVLAPPPKPGIGWMRPVAGLAVAASVAVVAILVAPVIMTADERSDTGQVAQIGNTAPIATLAALPAAGPKARTATQVVGQTTPKQHIDPTFADRLNRLVVEHSEFSGRTGIHGPVPHIGFVSHEMR